MTRVNKTRTGGGKKGLLAILIAANLIMLAIAIITIPQNLRRESEKTSALVDSADSSESLDTEDITDTSNPSEPNIGDEGQGEAAVSLSTNKRPDLGDFLWYVEGVFYDGIPTDAAPITDFAVLAGGWKGLIIYDPENEHGENAMEFLNVNIAGKLDNLSLTLDWYLMFIAGAGESFDETDMEDSVFRGKWEADGLWASGPGTIRLTKFYELNNNQYAIGTMDTPDGIPAYIAMVRP